MAVSFYLPPPAARRGVVGSSTKSPCSLRATSPQQLCPVRTRVAGLVEQGAPAATQHLKPGDLLAAYRAADASLPVHHCCVFMYRDARMFAEGSKVAFGQNQVSADLELRHSLHAAPAMAAWARDGHFMLVLLSSCRKISTPDRLRGGVIPADIKISTATPRTAYRRFRQALKRPLDPTFETESRQSAQRDPPSAVGPRAVAGALAATEKLSVQDAPSRAMAAWSSGSTIRDARTSSPQ